MVQRKENRAAGDSLRHRIRAGSTLISRICSSLLLICLLLSCAGITGENLPFITEEIRAAQDIGLEEMEGKIAGVMTGTPQDVIVTSNIDNVELLQFSSFPDIALALHNGKIDFYVNSTMGYWNITETYPEFRYINHVLRTMGMGAIFSKTEAGEKLCSEFNAFLKKAGADGTIDALKADWLFSGGDGTVEEPEAFRLFTQSWKPVDIPKTGEKGTLYMAVSSTMKPYAFLINNQFAGFDVAVAAAFCKEAGYGLVITDVEFKGALSGVASGKFDFAAGQIAYTQERAESVLYSDLYADQDIVAIIKGTTDQAAQSTTGGTNKTIWSSIRRTLLEENRLQIILGGLGVTLIITVFGFLLANLVGILFCAMDLSGNKALQIIADIYSRIMQGTPIVVVLMILYYVVFGNSRISGIIVAIIGFGITTGAYLAQLFRGGISGIDRGQTEAALAIGFTRWQAFMGIVLPQAIRAMLPGYFSNLISLMKGTAIVGYIAVVDLTKAGDIIRGSTFEPFAPLLIVALIYFGIACLLLSIMKCLQKRLAPKRVKSAAEGRVKS